MKNFLELELYRKKKVEVKANSGSSVSFMIVPRDLGYITIKATANSILAGDSVERKLLVKVKYFFIKLLFIFRQLEVNLNFSTNLCTG